MGCEVEAGGLIVEGTVVGRLTDGNGAVWDGVVVEGKLTAGRALDGTAAFCSCALGMGMGAGAICGRALGVGMGAGVIGRTVGCAEVGGDCEATTVDRGGVLATHVGAFALTEFEVCAFPETLLALTE